MLFILILLSSNFLISQTPKEESLIIYSSKFNILHTYVENPIVINQNFDSLIFEGGTVKILNAKIYITPNESGYKQLYLHKNGNTMTYPFRVKDIEIKPQIIFRRESHARRGKIQDKTMIRVIWEIDYDVKLVINRFKIKITKSSHLKFNIINKTNKFNLSARKAFQNLEVGDKLKITEIDCLLPNGKNLKAEDYEIIIQN